MSWKGESGSRDHRGVNEISARISGAHDLVSLWFSDAAWSIKSREQSICDWGHAERQNLHPSRKGDAARVGTREFASGELHAVVRRGSFVLIARRDGDGRYEAEQLGGTDG